MSGWPAVSTTVNPAAASSPLPRITATAGSRARTQSPPKRAAAMVAEKLAAAILEQAP